MTAQRSTPPIGVMMGSSSDWEVMHHAVGMLAQFGIPFETQVVSAHHMPGGMFGYAETARGRGLRAIITSTNGAAHLPGTTVAKAIVPMFNTSVPSKYLRGENSLLSIVQMSKSILASTFAIGEAGAANAALATIATIATTDSALANKFKAFRAQQTEVTRGMTLPMHGT